MASSSRWKRFSFFDRKNLSLPNAVWEDVSPNDDGALSLAVITPRDPLNHHFHMSSIRSCSHPWCILFHVWLKNLLLPIKHWNHHEYMPWPSKSLDHPQSSFRYTHKHWRSNELVRRLCGWLHTPNWLVYYGCDPMLNKCWYDNQSIPVPRLFTRDHFTYSCSCFFILLL